MLCSVIIPLYNKASFIEAAIHSVLEQRYSNFEIIVVDDGSTDDGASLVLAIHDARIHLVQQSNQGVSSARNLGVELAKGNLVCFLDADDWYLPLYLEAVVAMAERYPSVGFFATGYKRVSAQRPTEMVWACGDIHRLEAIDDLFKRWRSSGAFFCTNSVAVRRDLLVSLQPCFPPAEAMGEDQDLWFRLALQSPLLYCAEALVGYRVDLTDSLCAQHEAHDLLPVFSRLESRALRQKIPKALRSSAIRLVAEMKIGAARRTLIAGERYRALLQLFAAWRGMVSRRWWVSMALCLLGTPRLARDWESWRQRRTRTW